MIVFLVGYRGTGKSTVGERLATATGMTWVDSDAEIERRTRHTINDIFQSLGEPSFRRIEREVIAELVTQASGGCAPELVISLGGGAVLDEETRKLVRERGRCVWLRAAPDVLVARLAADQQRPPLTDLAPVEEVRHLLAVREPVYAECADFTIDVDGLEPQQVADRIAEWLARDDINDVTAS